MRVARVIILCLSASLFTSDLDDLFDVTKELKPVFAKWKNIGIALRLNHDILDGIQVGNCNNPQACLTLMLTEWLKGNYNVKRFGEPNWRWLVDAVVTQQVENTWGLQGT